MLYYLLQYIKRCHPCAKEDQRIELLLKSQSDVQFDVERYLTETPPGWNIHPKSKPLEVRNK